MILQVFAVYDSKAGSHAVPFFQASLGMAARSFSEAANQAEHPICKHPHDFTLFHIGSWNDETAIFTPLPEGNKNLGLASNYKKESI